MKKFYKIVNQVALTLVLFCSFNNLLAQNSYKINGLVKDINGEALPSVIIKYSGSTITAITDNNGKFSITVPDKSGTLIFSFIGFIQQTIPINNSSVINVTLKEENKSLSDVVITGYQSVKRGDITGSIGSVNVKKTQESSESGLDGLLAGRIAGVNVNEVSAEPGAPASVEIRGTNSISSSSAPLYVIDGVPYNAPTLNNLTDRNGFYANTTSNPLALINVNDIERIDVLKDASATAIYGSRGANGVVLITTKSGKSGVTQLSLNYNVSVSQISKTIKMMNSQDYALYINELRTFRNSTPINAFNPDSIKYLPYYDHFKEVTQLGKTNDLNLQLSGGNQKSKFFLSGQYFSQQGVVIKSQYDKANFRFSYQSQISKKFSLNTIFNGSYSQNKGTSSSIILSAIRWAPTSPLILPDGTYNTVNDYRYNNYLFPNPIVDLTVTDNNPISLAENFDNRGTQGNLNSNIAGTYTFNEHFTLLQRIGINYYNATVEGYRPTYQPTSSGFKGRANLGGQINQTMSTETNFQYNQSFGKHNFNALAVFTTEQYFNEDSKTGTQAFTQDITGVYNISLGNSLEVPASTYSDYKIISYISRLNYNYASKYYLTLTGRYDGTSKFADANKYGFFPSSALSWRLSNEKFFIDNVHFISDLKFRASYGVSGNQSGVDPYATLASLATGSNQGTLTYYNAAFNGVQISGFAPVRLPNSDLKWETSKTINFGLDLSLLKDRINLTVDAYQKKTDNLLLSVNLPTSSGFSTATMNVGAIQNKGLEFTVSTINTTGKVAWQSEFNMSFNKNMLVALSSGQTYRDLGSSPGLASPYSRIEVGKEIGLLYGYVSDGIYNDATIAAKPSTFQPGVVPGDRKFKDLNGDGVLTANDRSYIGNTLPKFTGGLSNSVKYKNLELNVFLRFSYGNKALNYIRWNGLLATNLSTNLEADAVNRWTPTNQGSNITRAGVSATDFRNIADYMVEDASFIKIPLLSFSYGLPNLLLKRLGVKNCRIFTSVNNVYTFTKYSGLDPEVNSQGTTGLIRGIDNGTYPPARIYKLGFNITL